jgi:hypothetical protein
MPKRPVLDIPNRPPDQRFWVVRASGGQFVRHFAQAGIVAIGHLDFLNLPLTGSGARRLELEAPTLEKQIASARKLTERGAASHVNQVKRFISEISLGDLVVTVDSRHLIIGRVIGNPYISRDSVFLRSTDERSARRDPESPMRYQLRRKIAWGPMMRRKDLPYSTSNSLFAHQTVFNFDKYWETVYHLLYPAFTAEDEFFFTINIKETKPLNNYAVTQLFALLTEFEILSRSTDKDVRALSFEQFLQGIEPSDMLLSTQAGFMSKGSVRGRIPLDGEAIGRYATALALLLTGGKGENTWLGNLSLSGFLDLPAVHEAIKRMDLHQANTIRKLLKLEAPSTERTGPLRDASKDDHARPEIIVTDNRE